MDRFLRYTTQKEPALTASFLAAVLLAIAARYLGLTDEDLVDPRSGRAHRRRRRHPRRVFAPPRSRDLLEPDEQDEP